MAALECNLQNSIKHEITPSQLQTMSTEHEQSQFQITIDDFLLERCAYCDKKMELVEGDVIYGEKWFHNTCWEEMKENSKNVQK